MHVTTVCSLVYLFDNNGICLSMSLSGPTKGKRSGYGGKRKPDETIRDCAIRETKEESGGIQVLELDKRGVVTFHWGSKQYVPGLSVERCMDVEVHVYRSDLWEGFPIATDAFSDPSFFPIDQIPFHEMMPCEELWFAQLLAGMSSLPRCTFANATARSTVEKGTCTSKPATTYSLSPGQLGLFSRVV